MSSEDDLIHILTDSWNDEGEKANMDWVIESIKALGLSIGITHKDNTYTKTIWEPQEIIDSNKDKGILQRQFFSLWSHKEEDVWFFIVGKMGNSTSYVIGLKCDIAYWVSYDEWL
jgi:hypothetical protein